MARRWGLTIGWLGAAAVAAAQPPLVEPAVVPAPTLPAGPVVQVQQPAPPVAPQAPAGTDLEALARQEAAAAATPQPAAAAPAAADRTGGTQALAPTNQGTSAAVRPEAAAATPAGSTTSAISGAGGAAAAAAAAPDVGDLLTKSAASTGVEVQRRNAIVGDPRVRGWRTGQFLTYGDGGLFVPARLDLDTAASKFDPASVRDIIVVKGPYTALYGPAFSVLDVGTLDAPRYSKFEQHGRTAVGYNTNGRRWDGLQSVSVGDRDWGLRATYNILQGNDYKAGDGTNIPGSYLSHNVNLAVGLTLTEKSRLEYKALQVYQRNLEFPGLYFDVANLDSAAHSLRYVLDDQCLFDRLTLSTWYNATAANGNTAGGAKQAFVRQLLFQSFNPQFPAGFPLSAAADDPTARLFEDASAARFASRSLGYRLAASWGPKDDPLLTAGTDLSAVGQGLVENIRVRQISGPNVNTGVPVTAPVEFSQNQSIPESNAVNPGLFMQSKLPLGERFSVKSGGRVDWVRASSNPRLITGSIDLFGSPVAPGTPVERFVLDPSVYSTNPLSARDLTRNFLLLSGFTQAEYKVDKHWTALAAFGYAERAPTLTELYAAGPFVGVLQQGTSRLIGDPNLRPEKLTQFDLGLRADYQYVQAGVNTFYAWVNDYITYDANRSGLGLTQVVYTNTDRATLAGVEGFLQADATAWLTPFATLSFVQGIDQTHRDSRRPLDLDSSRRDSPVTGRRVPDTEPLPQIPPLESRLGFRLHAPTTAPRWQVEFTARVVTGQNSVADSLGERVTPGFTTFSIRGYWKVRDNWLLTAGVENLGNKTYREHLDPISGNLLGVNPLLRPGVNFSFGSQLTY